MIAFYEEANTLIDRHVELWTETTKGSGKVKTDSYDDEFDYFTLAMVNADTSEDGGAVYQLALIKVDTDSHGEEE
jgi:hypothetical protein